MIYTADVVIPCYREEAALPHSARQILAHFHALISDSNNGLATFRLLLVDDGSDDSTWQIIANLAAAHPEIEGIRLARNYGHQAAMLAGLSAARADIVISMDADLQDDISAITRMIQAYENGAHLALGVREDRSTDTLGKRGWAGAYYRLLSLLGVDIIENHADFRLMSQPALRALLDHQEVNLFLRGIIPTLGFNVALIPYPR